MKYIALTMILVFVASPVFAGARAPVNTIVSCKSTGSPVAKILTFDPSDKDIPGGLSIALQMGLTPASFPADDIAKIATPCKRGEFTSGELVYALYGTDDALPYRWATTPSHPGETAFVATMPQPKPALSWYRKYQADNKTEAHFATDTETMFVLAITSNDKREIYRFYSAEPDDSTLSSDMCAALSGDLPIIAIFTEGSDDLDLSHIFDGPRNTPSACQAKP